MEEARELKLRKARKQVAEQKGWYSHLVIYLVVNSIIQLGYAGVFDGGSVSGHIPYFVRFTTPGFWGLSLFIHWLWVFKGNIFKNNFFTRWEEKKIQQFMKEEEEEVSTRIRKMD